MLTIPLVPELPSNVLCGWVAEGEQVYQACLPIQIVVSKYDMYKSECLYGIP